MQTILSYHVYDSEAREWLADDERTWTTNFHGSASFTDFQLASDIMTRAGGDYIFACMGIA